MKEEQDVSGTAQPEEESKTKKYLRIFIACFGVALIALVFITAALKKCAS